MPVTMYDSTEPSAIPTSAALVASYVDGYGGYTAAVARFGAAKCVSISVENNNADVADVESGAMTAAELPGWIARQQARGIARPVVYCNASTWPSVKAAVGNADVSYWIAEWTGNATQTLAGADAVQYASNNSYDESYVLDTFPFYPGTPAPTPTPTPTPTPVNPWPMSNGSSGTNVTTLQGNLNKWASVIKLTEPLTTDGKLSGRSRRLLLNSLRLISVKLRMGLLMKPCGTT